MKQRLVLHGGICFAIFAVLTGMAIFSSKIQWGFFGYVAFLVSGTIFSTIGVAVGDALRRFVMPDVYLAKNAVDSFKKKVFWSIGPQAIGLFLGFVATNGFMQNYLGYDMKTGRGRGMSAAEMEKLKAEIVQPMDGSASHAAPEREALTDLQELPSSRQGEAQMPMPEPQVRQTVSVRVIQVRNNQVTTVGGDLLAAAEDGSAVGPKVLVLQGMKLNGLTNDLVTLLTVYRYADRDVVLLTHGCGGSACSYTSIAVMDITAQGAPMLFQHDDLTIMGDGQEPEVKVQPDGSLLVSFEGFKGRQTWRYAQRELVKL